jgi:hypothetical protein
MLPVDASSAALYTITLARDSCTLENDEGDVEEEAAVATDAGAKRSG